MAWFTILPRPFLKRTRTESSPWEKVSVIVAARNEETHLRQALLSLLSIDYPNLEIICVNDRSDDRTGDILDEVARENPKLVPVHIESLPPLWLGKTHAHWEGAKHASGDWLLFTDGDVFFRKDVLRLSIDHVEAGGFDHLALLPRMLPGGFWENFMKATFMYMFMLATHPWNARKKSSRSFVGVGAFNLIRKTTYNAIGGHEALRMEVVDDMKMGKLVKTNGFRQDCLDGGEFVQVRWQEGLMGVLRGLEKNCFAGFSYRWSYLILATVALSVAMLGPYLALGFYDRPEAVGFLAALGVANLYFAGSLWNMANIWWAAPLFPVSVVLFLYVLWRSAWVTSRQRGIRWRDTFYPLDELKKGVV